MPGIIDDDLQSLNRRELTYIEGRDERYDFPDTQPLPDIPGLDILAIPPKLAAAAMRSSMVGAYMVGDEGRTDGIKDDPNFNPWDHLTDAELDDENFIDEVITADSFGEIDAARRARDREIADHKTVSSAGAFGFGVATLVEFANPIQYLAPGGVFVNTYRAGHGILKSSAALVATNSGVEAVSEFAHHQRSITRTWTDSALNMGGNLLISGGVAALISGSVGKKGITEAIAKKAKEQINKETADVMDVEVKIKEGFNPIFTREDAPLFTDLSARANFIDDIESNLIEQTIDELFPEAITKLARGEVKALQKIRVELEQARNILIKNSTDPEDLELQIDALIASNRNLSRRAAKKRALKDQNLKLETSKAEVDKKLKEIEDLVLKDEKAAKAKADLSRLEQGIVPPNMAAKLDILMAEFMESGHAQASTLTRTNKPSSILPDEGIAKASGPSTAGAMRVKEEEARIRGKAARAIVEWVSFGPLGRTSTSIDPNVRRASSMLSENPLDLEQEFVDQSVETITKHNISRRINKAKRIANDNYKKYRKNGGKLKRRDINVRVFDAGNNFDQHEIPEVASTAQAYRKHVYDPNLHDAINTLDSSGKSVLPKDLAELDPEAQTSYLNRIWIADEVAAKLPEFIAIVAPWLRKQDVKLFNDADVAVTTVIQVDAKIDEALLQVRRQQLEKRLAKKKATLVEVRTLDAEEITGVKGKKAFAVKDKKAKAEEFTGTQKDIEELETEIKSVNAEIREGKKGRIITDEEAPLLSEKQIDLLDADKPSVERIDAIRKEAAQEVDIRGKTDEEIKLFVKNLKDRKKELKRLLRRAEFKRKLDFEPQEYDEIAEEIAGRIMASPGHRLPYSYKIGENSDGGTSPNVRGPLAKRSFLIDNHSVRDFIEKDGDLLPDLYNASMIRTLEHIKAFGTTDITKSHIFSEASRSWNKRILAEPKPRKRVRLKNRRDRNLRDLKVMSERIQNIYNINPATLSDRIFRVLRDSNYLSKMGGVVAASFSDTGRIIAAEGIEATFNDGLVPMMRGLEGFKMAAREAEEYGAGEDLIARSGRGEVMSEVSNYTGGGTWFERGVRSLATSYSRINLMDYWTAYTKQLHAVVMQNRMIKSIKAGEYDKRLGQLGISREDVVNIKTELDVNAKHIDGVWIAQPNEWADMKLSMKWGAAIRKESDRVILMPGQERPIFMSSEFGKTLFQFKSFMLSATTRILASNLQKQDAHYIQGILSMVTFGMMSYAFKTWDAGRELSEDPRVWILEGIDRSGMLGVFSEFDNTLSKLSGNRFGLRRAFGVGDPAARTHSWGLLETAIGPGFGGTLSTILKVLGASMDEQGWTPSDTRAVRRLMFYNNLSGFRQAVSAVEKGFY